MPLKSYGVLKARVIDRRLGAGSSPHYQIHAVDEELDWRVAVNVRSAQTPSEVEYLVVDHFAHSITEALAALPLGFHQLPPTLAGGGLDYIRGNLFDPRDMKPLPFDVPGPDNDLNEKIDHFVQRAMAGEDAEIYAFGERWGPETAKDRYFGFRPGNGIHDVHMNQGNSSSYAKDDGVWQDGGVLLHFPTASQWVAIFLKFQSQAWHTDDATGHTLPASGGGPPADQGTGSGPLSDPNTLPTTDQPDGLVRIVAALVNATDSPETETVTLLNTSPGAIDLAGWALLDRNEKQLRLSGQLAAGGVVTLKVRPSIELSNKGGLITLINDQGLRVDGVSYTREQAKNPGWTIVF